MMDMVSFARGPMILQQPRSSRRIEIVRSNVVYQSLPHPPLGLYGLVGFYCAVMHAFGVSRATHTRVPPGKMRSWINWPHRLAVLQLGMRGALCA